MRSKTALLLSCLSAGLGLAGAILGIVEGSITITVSGAVVGASGAFLAYQSRQPQTRTQALRISNRRLVFLWSLALIISSIFAYGVIETDIDDRRPIGIALIVLVIGFTAGLTALAKRSEASRKSHL